MVLTREKNYVYFLANDRKAPKKRCPCRSVVVYSQKKLLALFGTQGFLT